MIYNLLNLFLLLLILQFETSLFYLHITIQLLITLEVWWMPLELPHDNLLFRFFVRLKSVYQLEDFYGFSLGNLFNESDVLDWCLS